VAGRKGHGWLTGTVPTCTVMNDRACSSNFCTEASRSDSSNATTALFAPGVWPISVVVMVRGASSRSYSTQTSW